MGFGDQGRIGLDDFIESTAFGDALSVFIHIPKTAGSSLSTELATLRPPYFNIHRRYSMGDTVTFSRIEDEIDTFVADHGDAARACSGHFAYMRAGAIRRARPDAQFFSFVRDPVRRVISDYRYQRTAAHPTHRQFIARFPDFDAYLDDDASRDKMARFLVPRRYRGADAIEDFLDTHYAFIGMVEEYAMSFDILSHLMGSPRQATVHKRVTEDNDDNMVIEDADLHARVAAANPRDMMIYAIVAERFAQMKADARLRP